ncbi:hypothetical protein HK099_001888, partial [Clydaea vesicula]
MRCDINQNSMLPSLLLPALKPKNKVDIDRKFELEKINNTVVVKKASTIRKPVVYKSPEEEKLVKSSTIKIQELPPLQKELHVGEWHLGAVLGKGASGIVRCGVNYITGEKAAIKIIKRPQIDHGKNRHEEEERVQRQEMYLIREVFIAYSLRHQNINRLRAFCDAGLFQLYVKFLKDNTTSAKTALFIVTGIVNIITSKENTVGPYIYPSNGTTGNTFVQSLINTRLIYELFNILLQQEQQLEVAKLELINLKEEDIEIDSNDIEDTYQKTSALKNDKKKNDENNFNKINKDLFLNFENRKE